MGLENQEKAGEQLRRALTQVSYETAFLPKSDFFSFVSR
jgi:hypothetical protein